MKGSSVGCCSLQFWNLSKLHWTLAAELDDIFGNTGGELTNLPFFKSLYLLDTLLELCIWFRWRNAPIDAMLF